MEMDGLKDCRNLVKERALGRCSFIFTKIKVRKLTLVASYRKLHVKRRLTRPLYYRFFIRPRSH
jgi:hypothetical protein